MEVGQSRAARGERSERGRSDNSERGNLTERGEPRSDARSERRPDRNRQPDDNARADAVSGDATRVNADSAASAALDRTAAQAQGAASGTDQGRPAPDSASRTDAVEPRDRQSRDRYGRDRGPRADRPEQGERQERPAR